jgi:dTMP kinase
VAVPGLFITIEGIDGAGKTTQARLLAEWLRGLGRRVCATREPGGTSAGERIRDLVLSREWAIPAEAELFLYLADRTIHVSQLVKPALAAGDVVVCERYTDSTLAYQGYGRGLDLGLLRQLNETATGGLVPDLTLVLDLPVNMVRLDEGRLDRLESEGRGFLARVAAGFRELAEKEPGRVKLIDGSGEVQTVHGKMVAAVQRLLDEKGAGS